MPETNSTMSSGSLLARELHVRTLQNKIVVFLVALMTFLFWPQISWAWSWYKEDIKALTDIRVFLEAKKTVQAWIIRDVTLLKDISSEWKKTAIVQCYNTQCKTLPEEIQKEPAKSAFKAFLQLQQAGKTKFIIDQKKLLIYLNEFLVKSSDGTVNGQVVGISFSSPVQTRTPWLVRIPTSMQLSFPNKQSLLWYLRNIEQVISTKYPMLTVVHSVTYDIVKSDEWQDVDVSLDIYMIQ
jgi:hypothetical protein